MGRTGMTLKNLLKIAAIIVAAMVTNILNNKTINDYENEHY